VVASTIIFMTNIKSETKLDCILINRILENNLIAKMFIYSAIKIMANNPLLYSTLNPDTSSDSPSAKSNGVRFVSAKFVINHTTNSGSSISIIHVYIFIFEKSIVIIKISPLNMISDIDTSYEIV
jgi:hypothetical protein